MLRYPMQRIGVSAGFSIYNPFADTPTMHYAIDISRTQPETSNIFAAHDGQVILSLFDSAGGNLVAIQGYYNEKKDIITRYAHLAIRSVFKGDTVTQGQVIGVQGNTGTAATAQHLHFETWIVPKNYSYSFNDRQTYAVDPLSICAVYPGQEFISDAETFNYEGMPYPQAEIEKFPVSDGKLMILGNVQMFNQPSERYSPHIAGYNRSKRYITDFFYETVFPCSCYCENEGLRWANVNTARGEYWVPVLDGKSILTGTGSDGNAVNMFAYGDAVRRLEAELASYKQAVTQLNDIISKLS